MADSQNGFDGTRHNEPNEFLTADLFHAIISKHLISEPFKIIKLENKPAFGVGENYMSKILNNVVDVRLDDGTTNKFSFISKIIGSEMLGEAILEEMKVFPKEVESYVNIVPEFEKIWKDTAKIDISFGPKLYYHELEPHKILIFEDLNDAGFKMPNRLEGLTEQQVLIILEKISKWHAVSRVYYEQRGSVHPMFNKGLLNSGMVDYLGAYYSLMYKSLMEILSTEDIDEVHMEALKKWDNHLLPNLLKVVTVDPNEFNVLNHGDLWINNVMLEGDASGRSNDVKFIDFQLGFYGCPVIELLYFLVMSTKTEIFTEKFDQFIASYHCFLTESLRRLNYHKIPTLKELWIAMLNKSFYLIVMIVGGIPSILTDHKKYDVDMKCADRDDEIGYQTRKKMMGNPKVLANLKMLIEFFGRRGMLDL